MMSIEVNNLRLKYVYLQHVVQRSSESGSKPYFIYDRYGTDFLDRLYMIQNSVSACHALVLFEPRDTGKVLRHINILDGFTFTLVPSEINSDVYEEIYEFFMNSKLSTSYITWIAKLLLKPYREVTKIAFNNIPVDYPECPELCLLRRVRSCSKGLLFTELCHPMKELPTDDEFSKFCAIHRKYSSQIVRDYLENETDMHAFSKVRKNFGINNQFWIDPQRLFVGDPVEKGVVINSVNAWLKNIGGHQGIAVSPVDLAREIIEACPEKAVPLIRVGFTSCDSDAIALEIDHKDDTEEKTLLEHIDNYLPKPLLCELSAVALSSNVAKEYSTIALDYKAAAIDRVSVYYRFSDKLRHLRALQSLFEISPFGLRFDSQRFQTFIDLLHEDFDAAGFALKIRPATGVETLELSANIRFALAYNYAMLCLPDSEKKDFEDLSSYLKDHLADCLDYIYMRVEAASNHQNSPLLFSIDISDVSGAELFDLLHRFGNPGVEDKRFQLIAGWNWKEELFDCVKFIFGKQQSGITVTYSISHGKSARGRRSL